MYLWEEAKEKTLPETQTLCDHLAQGHVPKLVSCHKTKVYSKLTQDHLLAEPLAWGTGAYASSGI